MNIFEQEDLIKGLPDESLMKEAQSPSGPLPQYLIVSEIQRRQDMRKRFSQQGEQSPQGTVKDQILSGGIAELGSQPPMGQPPQMGQPPMGQPPQMGPPPQMGQPAMGPPPQMGQPPMGMPPQMSMQQPMGMAAGGVVRMAGGQDAPFTSPYLQDLATYNQEVMPMGQQIGDLERAALQLRGDQRNAARRQSLGIQDQVGDLYGSTLGDYSQDDRLETLLAMASPDEINNKIGELGLNPNFMSGVVGDLSEPDDATSQLQNLASRYPDSTAASLTSQLENLASRYPDSTAAKELMGTNPGISYAPLESLITKVRDSSAVTGDAEKLALSSGTKPNSAMINAAANESSTKTKVDADQSKSGSGRAASEKTYSDFIEDISNVPALTAKPNYSKATESLAGLTGISENLKANPANFANLIKQVEAPNLDFSDLQPSYLNLITESERRSNKIKEDAKKDAGAQALIQLGAGIAEGNVSEGLRGAGRVSSEIMKQARSESAAENQLARRMELAGKDAELNLGIKGRESAINKYNRDVDLITNQYRSDRADYLTGLGMERDAVKETVDIEVRIAEADYKASVEERKAVMDTIVQQAALKRFQDLALESGISINREMLRTVTPLISDMYENWSFENDKASLEQKAEKFQQILSQFINMDLLRKQMGMSENIAAPSSGQPKAKSPFDDVNPTDLIPTA